MQQIIFRLAHFIFFLLYFSNIYQIVCLSPTPNVCPYNKDFSLIFCNSSSMAAGEKILFKGTFRNLDCLFASGMLQFFIIPLILFFKCVNNVYYRICLVTKLKRDLASSGKCFLRVESDHKSIFDEDGMQSIHRVF